MDLQDLAGRESARVELRSPIDDTPLLDDDGAQMFVEVATSANPKYHERRRELRAEGITDEVEFLAKLAGGCILSCHVVMAKKELSPKEVADLFLKPPYFWLRDQVVLEGNKREALFGTPPGS